MAVVVSIARGHDASYPFKTIGAADGPTVTGERGAGYYLSAVEKGGEPAGTWIGDGAAELGFCDGAVVRREDFEPLYGQFLDPRDPSGQTHLGSPPRVNAELAAIYQAKLAAHPGATADERMRLLAEARAEYQGPVGVQYFDTTFSVDKTISLAHASALASAVEAREAGDLQAAGQWEARAAGIWAEVEQSVRLYVGHMQREAGFVRTRASRAADRRSGDWPVRGRPRDPGGDLPAAHQPQRRPAAARARALAEQGPDGPRRPMACHRLAWPAPEQGCRLGAGRVRAGDRAHAQVRVRVGVPAGQQGPGHRSGAGEGDPAVLLPPRADHQVHASSGRAVRDATAVTLPTSAR